MEKKLSDELLNAINKVGELIKADPRYREAVESTSAYSSDKEINEMLDEYSALQSSLSAEYEKTDFDESVIKPIRDRMNELYSAVMGNETYIRFKESSEAYREMTEAVYEELEYAVTGERRVECTHDCSTCHGCD